MSVREEFEAWARTDGPQADLLEPTTDVEAALPMSWNIWQLAYRAGALAMRGRAAIACLHLGGRCDATRAAAAIRALDVDADDRRSS